jgi:hypothetical protein
MSDEATADAFGPHVGTVASLPDGRRLTLVKVERGPAGRPGGAPRAGFSLLLSGDPERIVPEGLHRLAFDGGATFDLYVIPIHTASRDRQDYQIVFN